MSVFDVDPPIIDNKHLIKWLKINFSFLRNKLLKIKQLDSCLLYTSDAADDP